MDKLIRNAILLGMGSVYYSKEKFEEMLNDLSTKEKINPAEGKKLVKEVLQKAETYKKEHEKEVSSLLKKLVKEFNIATREDIEKLRNEMKNMGKPSAVKSKK